MTDEESDFYALHPLTILFVGKLSLLIRLAYGKPPSPRGKAFICAFTLLNSQFSKLYLLYTHEVGIIFFKELKADCKKIKDRRDSFGILLTHFEIEAAIAGLKCNI